VSNCAVLSVSGVAVRAAEQLMAYPFKVWGFGEEIGLRGLWELGRSLDEASYRGFVRALLRGWCQERGPLEPQDHVVPGMPLLLLYEAEGDKVYLEAALELGELLANSKEVHDLPLHRPDLKEWASHIWVDCLYLDAPFLLRLGCVTADERWVEVALRHLLPYARALRDDEKGLFYHGLDSATGERSPCLWGRGNGWALLGLIDALAELPPAHAAYPPLQAMLEAQVAALIRLQDASGHWHTVLDDPTSPLEPSCAALFAAGFWAAKRVGLVSTERWGTLGGEGSAERAFAAALASVDPAGGFAVSEATPIGNRETYVTRRLGTFPWGQGPLLLAAVESGQLGGGAA